MSDNYYYYRDQVKELQTVNDFVRKNTLLSVQNRIEYVRDEREKLGLPSYSNCSLITQMQTEI